MASRGFNLSLLEQEEGEEVEDGGEGQEEEREEEQEENLRLQSRRRWCVSWLRPMGR